MYLVRHDDLSTLSLLLENNLSPNLQLEKLKQKNVCVEEETPPLHIAVQRSNLKICDLLLFYGANVNEQDTFHRLPLSLALSIYPLSLDIIQSLLSSGASTGQTSNCSGDTSLHILVRERNFEYEQGVLECADLLIDEYKVDMEAVNYVCLSICVLL